jgi:metal-sulfur cluster biosynthetic enzyme
MSKKTSREQQVYKTLDTIEDPELGISLLALGLIYNVKIIGTRAEITMTLTTIGCPLFDQIKDDITAEVKKIDGIETVAIELTFDPPWSVEKISDEAKIELGID